MQGACTAEQELPHRSLAEPLLHSRMRFGQDEPQEEERGASTLWTELCQSSSFTSQAVGAGVTSEDSLNTSQTVWEPRTSLWMHWMG